LILFLGEFHEKLQLIKKKKEYASYDIEKLLLQENVDINNPDKNVEWLPIELFDDTTFDDFSNEEWMVRAENEK